MRKYLLKTSFLVMICISFFVFSYLFTVNKAARVEILRNEANANKKYIESNMNLNETYIESFKNLSESYLNNVPLDTQISPELYYDLINKNEIDENHYNMDEVIIKKLHTELGNLTGEGDYKNNRDLSYEIKMVLSLNPSFKQVWENSKYLTRIYYISEQKFINIYPWLSSDEYSFTEDLYNKEYYLNVLPDKNPNKTSRWSKPHKNDMNSEIVLTLSSPVSKDNEVRGVLNLDFSVKAISALLLENIKPDMSALLIDEENNIVGITDYKDEYEEVVMQAKNILPDKVDISEMKKLKVFDKVENINGYLVVKSNIKNFPWTLYLYQKNFQLSRQIFLEISPMLIITLALFVIYYELYSRKKSEKELEKIVRTLKRTTTKLEEESKTDHLTGLLNRRGLIEEIKKEHSRISRKKKEFSIIICDIDYFKRVNDTYGHDCGDIVLKNTAELMQVNVKEVDFVGRWGGEEFVIILIETTFKDAMRVAERLRKTIEKNIIEYDGNKFNVTMTFGVTEYNPDQNMDENIVHVDMALYQGKNTGRNKVVGNRRDGQYKMM